MQPADNTRSAVQYRRLRAIITRFLSIVIDVHRSRIYVNSTNHSDFQDRRVTVCETIGSPTVFRPTYLPTLTLVSCLLFTVPPAGQTGQTQTSDELSGPRVAAAWQFDPQPVPQTIEPHVRQRRLG